MNHPTFPHAANYAAAWALTLSIVFVGCIVCFVGCVTLAPADVQLIQKSKAANLGHMRDDALDDDARFIAQDNYDAFSQLDRAATGTPIPEDVRERLGLTEEAE